MGLAYTHPNNSVAALSLAEWVWSHETNAVIWIQQIIKDTNFTSPCIFPHISAATDTNFTSPCIFPHISAATDTNFTSPFPGPVYSHTCLFLETI